MKLLDIGPLSGDELQRMCWLRAVEWLAWPAFISQPLLPIFYLFYPVYWVLAAVFVAGLLWLPFRYRFVSRQLADLGCLWVRLKWVSIPIGIIALLHQRRYAAAVVTLATPWLAGLLNAPGKVGIVQARFLGTASPLSY